MTHNPSGKYSFVIVSNRLPVSVTKEKGHLTFHPSSGGLATAMSSVGQNQDKIWLGWPGIASDDLTSADKRTITRKLREYNCAPVFLTREQVAGYYDGYANDTLWPLFHYFHNRAVYDPVYWESYKQANRLFVRAVLRHADLTATIWVHDYHLMLLPRMLRRELPESSIGLFLHIPFPSYEIFRLLPHRAEILRGLLGADLVGFHTYDYSRHFTNSVINVLGYDAQNNTITVNNRQVATDAFPIGIDYQKFVTALKTPEVTSEIQQLKEHYAGQKLIISVDRLDYSKGIVNRLEAFDQFLERHPTYHGKVSLVVVAVPSRTDVDAYKQLRDTIERTVSRINGKYTTLEWSPIAYQYKNLPFEQVVALYAAADIALVTPLRDGMNLVAKEYVAAKQALPGVLILSEMTGAAHELAEAIRVNPYDAVNIVSALEQALTMPVAQQKRALRTMQARISQYNVSRWANDFTEQLASRHSNTADNGASQPLTAQAQTELLQAYESAKSRLFLLDYDGTLKDFVPPAQKDKARPSARLIGYLQALTSDPKNRVCIVSGRTRHILQAWFGDLPLTLVAEHGAWMRRDDNQWMSTDSDFASHKDKLLPILKSYTERTAGSMVEEKDFALVWHFRGVIPELAALRKAGLMHDLSSVVNGTDIALFEGNKILEIKPNTIHKGAVAKGLFDHTKANFILCAGDDYTDEDMFSALPRGAWTIRVGLGNTQARYHIGTVSEMVQLVGRLSSSKT